jgi:hypothetical protein
VQLESVEEYVIVEQYKMEVTIFRHATNWSPEVLRSPTDLLYSFP